MHVKHALINQPGTNPATQGATASKPGGTTTLNPVGTTAAPPLQQNQPAPQPMPPATATVMTGRSGRTHVIPANNTTVADLAQHFATAAGGKELRFAQSPGYNQKTLHVHQGALSGIGKGDARAQKKADAAQVVADAIDRQLGKPGAGQALLQKLEQDGAIKHADSLKVRDLATIATAVAGAVAEAARKDQADQKMGALLALRDQVKTNPPSQGDRQNALAAFHATPIPIGQDAQFKALSGGAWGALKVEGQTPEGNQVTFALKTENPMQHAKTRFVGDLFGHVEANATQPLPLGFMKTQVLELDTLGGSQLTPETHERLLDAIGGMVERGEGVKDGMPGGSEAWKAVLDPTSSQYNGGMVTKNEWVSGAMLADLEPMDKLGLIKSGALAEDLAHAAVLGPMFGLSDHAGLKGTSTRDETGYTNLSNFRMGETGKLTTIDFDVRIDPGLGGAVGKLPQNILGIYGDLIDHLKTLADHDDPAGALEAALPDNRGKVGNPNPLTDVTTEALHPRKKAAETSLLHPEDMQALGANYTKADRIGFSAQLTLHAADALQYLSDELKTFEAAHQAKPESALNGDNFFGQLRQLLNDADLPALRAKLGEQLGHITPPPFQ